MALVEDHIKNKKGLRLGVLNVNGISTEKEKQFKILENMKNDLVDVFILIDTRMVQSEETENKHAEIRDGLFCNKSCQGRGILVTKRDHVDVSFSNCMATNDGNKLTVDISSPYCEDFTLIAIYAPNNDDVGFVSDITTEMVSSSKNFLVSGDFNIKLNPLLDIKPPQPDRKPDNKTKFLCKKLDEGGVMEPFRAYNPDKKIYSYRHFRQKKYPLKTDMKVDLTSRLTPRNFFTIYIIYSMLVGVAIYWTMMPNILIFLAQVLRKLQTHLLKLQTVY